jgi:copper chaperone NosL
MRIRGTAALALLAVVAGAACGARADGPPPLEEDRTACAHCGMLVSERMFAAAYRAPGRDARVFDDIGCLLNAVREERAPSTLAFWFHDAGTRQWIDGRRAVIVRAESIRTPMSGGMLAYGTPEAAAAAAREHGGRVAGGIQRLLSEGAERGDGLPRAPGPGSGAESRAGKEGVK